MQRSNRVQHQKRPGTEAPGLSLTSTAGATPQKEDYLVTTDITTPRQLRLSAKSEPR